MSTEPNHIDELIANYLSGEASSEEMARVERWLNESDHNRKYFDQMKLIFDKAAAIPQAELFDVDRAWDKVRAKLPARRRGEIVPFRFGRPLYKTLLRVAAGITILLAIGFFADNILRTDATESLELLADKSTATDTLPEGSEVFLNRQTKIEYAFDRRKNVHTATIVGEAYFNINHTNQKTFIVRAEETLIKDIGTSFNVKAYPGSSTIEVVVEEGEVMFYTESNPGIYLRANGKGIYNKQTKTFTVAEPESNVAAYKTKFFSFSDHTLETVVQTLNGVYSTKIVIGGNLKSCRLTVSFNDETIDEIAGIIAETLGLSVSKSDNVITLEGKGCPEPRP